MAEAYKVTPIFDENTLPQALRNAHNTRPGTWGLLRVLSGELRLVFHDPHMVVMVDRAHPAIIPPQAVHHVEVTGPMQMRVEFHDAPPELPA